MQASHCVPLLQFTRGPTVESRHRGIVCVADATGRVLAALGNPESRVHARSSSKPFQALPFVMTGLADSIGATPEDLAVIQGSHSGEPMHTERIAALLTRLGLTLDDLACGVHPPFHVATRRAVAPNFTPLHHNCSGNHTALAAAARALRPQTSGAQYLDPAHPVNQAVQDAYLALAGVGRDVLALGVDGCGVPSYALPMRAVACAYARLADPRHAPPEYREPLARLFAAATANPALTSGTDEYETRAMRAAPGVFVKAGAEGYIALAVAPKDGAPGLGITIKIEDGDQGRPMRARPHVADAVLVGLGLLDVAPDALPGGPRTVSNSHGAIVGEVQLAFTPSHWRPSA